MSKELELLSSVTNIPSEELATKLQSEEGANEIKSQIEGYRIYRTDKDYETLLKDHKDSLKDKLYNEHKGSIHESLEKKLLHKHGVEFKQGTDFNSTDELIDKILEIKIASARASSKGDNKELEAALAKIQELTQSSALEKENLLKEFSSKLVNKEMDSALFGIKSKLDVEDDKLESALGYIKYQFGQEFSIQEKDGQFKVFKGDTVYRNNEHQEIPLDVVLQEIAGKSFKLKSSPVGGRGVLKTANETPLDNFDFSAYKTWEDLVAAKTELRKLTIGSPEYEKWYIAFKKSKGNG